MKREPPGNDGDMTDTSLSLPRYASNGASNGPPVMRSAVKESKQYAEYHFGVCTAEMMEDIPKENRAKLKAKIFSILAGAL